MSNFLLVSCSYCCLFVTSVLFCVPLLFRFSNLGILHVTKRGVGDVLTKRLREERKRALQPGFHFSGEIQFLRAHRAE